jgi:hypothetical protein
MSETNEGIIENLQRLWKTLEEQDGETIWEMRAGGIASLGKHGVHYLFSGSQHGMTNAERVFLCAIHNAFPAILERVAAGERQHEENVNLVARIAELEAEIARLRRNAGVSYGD